MENFGFTSTGGSSGGSVSALATITADLVSMVGYPISLGGKTLASAPLVYDGTQGIQVDFTTVGDTLTITSSYDITGATIIIIVK